MCIGVDRIQSTSSSPSPTVGATGEGPDQQTIDENGQEKVEEITAEVIDDDPEEIAIEA